MEEILELFSGVWGIIFILTLCFVAILASWLAKMKGYNSVAWFFLGLFGGLISLITIGFAPNKNENNYDIERIQTLLKPISQYYKAIADKEAQEKLQAKKERIEKEQENRKKKIDSMEKLLNDEKIKKESETILKNYGKFAQEKYLKNKMKEFNIDSD